MCKQVFLGLGGNHNNSIELIEIAVRKIEEIAKKIVKRSANYQTPPWGFEADHDFVNCVLWIEYEGEPEVLLHQIQAIEKELGRIRTGGSYTSRPMDIDILYFDNQTVNNNLLEIPHPRMYHRNFVMYPLNEIAPNWIDPVFKKSVSFLFKKCEDKSEISTL